MFLTGSNLFMHYQEMLGQPDSRVSRCWACCWNGAQHTIFMVKPVEPRHLGRYGIILKPIFSD